MDDGKYFLAPYLCIFAETHSSQCAGSQLGHLQWQVLRRVPACLTVNVTSVSTALLDAEVLPCGLGHCVTLAKYTTWHAEQC